MTKTLLLDINVWLALAFDGHVHHPVVRPWFDSITDEVCYFCRLTQQGFLRLATNPRVFKGDALTLADAWTAYDALLADSRVAFAAEPQGIELLWRSYTNSRSHSPQLWSDAYLAAFAVASGLKTITFDRGFRRFSNLQYDILS